MRLLSRIIWWSRAKSGGAGQRGGQTAVLDGFAGGGSFGPRRHLSQPFDSARGALGTTWQKTLEARVLTFSRVMRWATPKGYG